MKWQVRIDTASACGIFTLDDKIRANSFGTSIVAEAFCLRKDILLKDLGVFDQIIHQFGYEFYESVNNDWIDTAQLFHNKVYERKFTLAEYDWVDDLVSKFK